MIKIKYEQEPYGTNVFEGQPYDIKTEIVLNEDISASEAIIAFLRLLNIATYRVDLKYLKENVIKDLEDCGYKDNERIL